MRIFFKDLRIFFKDFRIFFKSLRIFFKDLIIFFKDLGIFFKDLGIFFQDLRKIFKSMIILFFKDFRILFRASSIFLKDLEIFFKLYFTVLSALAINVVIADNTDQKRAGGVGVQCLLTPPPLSMTQGLWQGLDDTLQPFLNHALFICRDIYNLP